MCFPDSPASTPSGAPSASPPPHTLSLFSKHLTFFPSSVSVPPHSLRCTPRTWHMLAPTSLLQRCLLNILRASIPLHIACILNYYTGLAAKGFLLRLVPESYKPIAAAASSSSSSSWLLKDATVNIHMQVLGNVFSLPVGCTLGPCITL